MKPVRQKTVLKWPMIRARDRANIRRYLIICAWKYIKSFASKISQEYNHEEKSNQEF